MSTRRRVWVFVLVLTLIGAAVLFSALAVRGRQGLSASASVLVWNVPSELDEAEAYVRVFGIGLMRPSRPALIDVIQALDRASMDDHVRALVLHVSDLDWGWAKLGDVREAVMRVRAAGKPVYAVIESGGDAEYFLASAANRVATLPAAELYVNGLAATAMFMRGTLDKLDIKPNFVLAGEYKSAVEFYERENMSPPAREAMEALVDHTFGVLVDSLASARKLSRDRVEQLIDMGPFDAPSARAYGLIDTIAHEIDIDSMAVRRAGGDAEIVSLSRYAERTTSGSQAHVAFVTASGTIVSGKSRYEAGEGLLLGAATMKDVLRDIGGRPSVKAVILRIDSPGGDALASDEIWSEVKRLNAQKPVIVSMSDVAASGGYYMAVGGRRIVAQPGTLTGSIGVFGGKLNLIGLFRKLGLNVETVSRGRHAEMLSPFSDFTPDEAAQYQRQVETTYHRFLQRVSEGRRISIAQADSAGRGRVWTGLEARQVGLVDTLGGIRTAFALAVDSARLQGSQPFVVERYPKVSRSFLDRLFEAWLSDDSNDDDVMARTMTPVMRAWITAAQFPAGHSLCLMPWSITVR